MNATLSKELETPYALPADVIDFYRENGYMKLKNVLSEATLDYYGDLITEWVFKLNTLTKPMEERTTYERAFLQIMNLWRHNDEIKEFVFSSRLANDWKTWLDSKPIGEIPDSYLNPVLWERHR